MKPPVLTLSSIDTTHRCFQIASVSHLAAQTQYMRVVRTEDPIRDQLFISRGALLSVLSYSSKCISVWQYNKLSPKNLEYQKLNSASIGGCWAYILFTVSHHYLNAVYNQEENHNSQTLSIAIHVQHCDYSMWKSTIREPIAIKVANSKHCDCMSFPSSCCSHCGMNSEKTYSHSLYALYVPHKHNMI